jgi:hypothetical protein
MGAEVVPFDSSYEERNYSSELKPPQRGGHTVRPTIPEAAANRRRSGGGGTELVRVKQPKQQIQ